MVEPLIQIEFPIRFATSVRFNLTRFSLVHRSDYHQAKSNHDGVGPLVLGLASPGVTGDLGRLASSRISVAFGTQVDAWMPG